MQFRTELLISFWLRYCFIAFEGFRIDRSIARSWNQGATSKPGLRIHFRDRHENFYQMIYILLFLWFRSHLGLQHQEALTRIFSKFYAHVDIRISRFKATKASSIHFLNLQKNSSQLKHISKWRFLFSLFFSSLWFFKLTLDHVGLIYRTFRWINYLKCSNQTVPWSMDYKL